MDMRRAIIVAVQHRTGGVLVGLQARECRGLPLLEDGLDLGGRGVVLGRPGDDAGGVAPLVRTAVGDLGDQVRVAAQHGDLGSPIAVMVMLLEQIAHRTGGAALTMAEKFQVHGSTSWPWTSGS
nr:hypothetical protein [Halomonas sp. ANAO-440]